MLDYTIQPGDTLTAIANANGVSIADIMAANTDSISDPNMIQAGAQLNIPELSDMNAPLAPGTQLGPALPPGGLPSTVTAAVSPWVYGAGVLALLGAWYFYSKEEE